MKKIYSRKKFEAEQELLKAQIAESRSNMIKNYCITIAIVMGQIIKFHLS